MEEPIKGFWKKYETLVGKSRMEHIKIITDGIEKNNTLKDKALRQYANAKILTNYFDDLIRYKEAKRNG